MFYKLKELYIYNQAIENVLVIYNIMKIPGWWRIRHAYNDAKRISKKINSKVTIYLETLSLKHNHKRYYVKIVLPSEKMLASMTRKQLLELAHKYDLNSFSVSSKTTLTWKGSFYIKVFNIYCKLTKSVKA